jgi:hypothetical protein
MSVSDYSSNQQRRIKYSTVHVCIVDMRLEIAIDDEMVIVLYCTVQLFLAGHGIHASRQTRMYSYLGRTWHLGKPGCTVIWAGHGIYASRQTRM